MSPVTDNAATATNILCPRCQSNCCVRNGHSWGKQRFLCKECCKVFSVESGDSRLRLTVEHEEFLSMCHLALTLRITAELIGVSLTTAFRWRHQYLAALLAAAPVPVPAATVAYSSSPITIKASDTIGGGVGQGGYAPMARIPQSDVPIAGFGKRVGQAVHLLWQDDEGIKLRNFYTQEITRIVSANSLQTHISPGTCICFAAGTSARLIPSPLLPDTEFALHINSPGHIQQRLAPKPVASLEQSLQRAADLTWRVYRRWMSRFFGVRLANIAKYTAWFNICWRDAAQKYAQYWRRTLPELLVNYV